MEYVKGMGLLGIAALDETVQLRRIELGSSGGK